MPLHPKTQSSLMYYRTPSSLASFKSRLVLPFWYWLTQVVLENRPLNGCSSNSSGLQHRAYSSGETAQRYGIRLTINRQRVWFTVTLQCSCMASLPNAHLTGKRRKNLIFSAFGLWWLLYHPSYDVIHEVFVWFVYICLCKSWSDLAWYFCFWPKFSVTSRCAY